MPEFFGGISFSAKAIADLIFFLAATVAAVMSLILFFHWRKYGMGGAMLAFVELVYLGISAALLAVAFFSLK